MAANPKANSFRDIVLNYTGLLVNPLQWTSCHLDLVGCRFEDVETPSVSVDDKDNDTPKTCPKQPSDAEAIALNISYHVKQRHLIHMLVGKKRRFASFRADLFIDQTILYSIVMETPSISSAMAHPRWWAILHYSNVNGDRRRQFAPCPHPRGKPNSIGGRICRKRVAQTTPEHWTEDPYFMCHLLALAQRQERKLGSSNPMTYTSRLVVNYVLDREYMLFYEAEITTELLNGLRDPKNATSPLKWLAIRRKKLPYKPYYTFADLLVAELVAPSPSSPSVDVNGVIEHGRKRPREEDDELNNSKSISKR